MRKPNLELLTSSVAGSGTVFGRDKSVIITTTSTVIELLTRGQTKIIVPSDLASSYTIGANGFVFLETARSQSCAYIQVTR